MPKSEEALKIFMCFSGSVLHASKDGRITLCGRSIESTWREVKPEAWDGWCKKCPRCKPVADRLDLRGEQSNLIETTKETTE